MKIWQVYLADGTSMTAYPKHLGTYTDLTPVKSKYPPTDEVHEYRDGLVTWTYGWDSINCYPGILDPT